METIIVVLLFLIAFKKGQQILFGKDHYFEINTSDLIAWPRRRSLRRIKWFDKIVPDEDHSLICLPRGSIFLYEYHFLFFKLTWKIKELNEVGMIYPKGYSYINDTPQGVAEKYKRLCDTGYFD